MASRVAIRARGQFDSARLAAYDDNDLVNADEHRPFWIGFNDGILTIGKGGQETGFLEWDAGAYHGKIHVEVYVGVASYKHASGDWVFYQTCK